MIVVGCGKAKLDRSAPARELYTGSLFVAARRYAEASGRPWVILSGVHGVISPDLVLRPYDAGPPVGVEQLERWARLAADRVTELVMEDEEQLRQWTRHGQWPRVELLVGVRYARPLAEQLLVRNVLSDQPLLGLGMGQRLRRLGEMAAKAWG